MKNIIRLAGIAFLLAMTNTVLADAKTAKINEHVKKSIKAWANDPVVIKAINEQNKKHNTLAQAEIDKLDKQWRSEAKDVPGNLIVSVLKNELSKYLASVKEKSKGVYTEIFVMDNKGLNVGTSDVTSDYWQGDEAKWKETFLKGPNAVHIGKIELDESTRQYQSQASVSIVDPKTKKVIGAITVGINVDELK